MMTPREEDLQAVKDAVRWMRLIVLEGMHKGFIDGIGFDQASDVLLRLEKAKERMDEK
jgi:hypothetical protein